MNKCEYCGKTVEKGMSTCSGCGSPVTYIEPEIIAPNTVILNSSQHSFEKKKPMKSIFVILWLFFFYPVGLYFMWSRSSWNKVLKIIISVLFALATVSALVDDNKSDPASTKEKVENVK